VEDLAIRLGTVGSVECLERSAIGPFLIADSMHLISEPGSRREGLLANAIPMSEALRHLPSVRVDARWVHRVRQGGVPPRNGFRFDGPPQPETSVRVLGPERELLALGRVEMLPGPAEQSLEDACTLRLERVI
jgi:tRNA U55 pseudouridine synthase TruB